MIIIVLTDISYYLSFINYALQTIVLYGITMAVPEHVSYQILVKFLQTRRG